MADVVATRTIRAGDASMDVRVREERERILELNRQRREARPVVDTHVSAARKRDPLAPAVAAVIAKLPPSGAITMAWSDLLKLVQWNELSAGEGLQEFQDALRRADVLAVFGKRVAVFARDIS